MSITTYGELKTAVANWLHRDDLTTEIPDFIVSAESRIASYVRHRAMITRTTLTVDSQYETIPSDVIELQDMEITSDPIQPLTYLAPDVFSRKLPSSTTGKPQYYTIHGSEFEFKPIPSTSYTLAYTYYGKLTAFSDDADTNTLLTNYPFIYVYGACLEGSNFLENDQAAAKFNQLFTDEAMRINDAEKRMQKGVRLTSRVNVATP